MGPVNHIQLTKGRKIKKKLKSTFHSIGLFRIICSTDYKKRSENILMTSHLEVNHLQITCWRILGNKAKKGDFNYRGNIDEGMFVFLLSFYFSQDLKRSS